MRYVYDPPAPLVFDRPRGRRSAAMRRRLGQPDIAILRTMLMGNSSAVIHLREEIDRYGRYDVPVVIEGETGSGKELVARGIHLVSRRSKQPYVAVNCATLQPELAASTLFGHVRGAFTGAVSVNRGLFMEADGGTLFLDEVAELPPQVQAMLLRVLEQRAVLKVGGSRAEKVDVRVVVATHASLQKLVSSGLFREDLYYRLEVAMIQVPTLQERKADIEPLSRMLLSRGRARLGLRSSGFSSDAISALKRARWPGNVRQLRNVIARAAMIAGPAEIDVGDVRAAMPERLPSVVRKAARTRSELADLSLSCQIDEVRDAVIASEGNMTAAARLLGISRSTLYDRMRRLGIRS